MGTAKAHTESDANAIWKKGLHAGAEAREGPAAFYIDRARTSGWHCDSSALLAATPAAAALAAYREASPAAPYCVAEKGPATKKGGGRGQSDEPGGQWREHRCTAPRGTIARRGSPNAKAGQKLLLTSDAMAADRAERSEASVRASAWEMGSENTRIKGEAVPRRRGRAYFIA